MAIKKIGDTDKKKLLDYLDDELRRAKRNVYDPLQKKFDSLDDSYYGVTKPRRRKWMSNFPILMGATFADAVRARLMNTLTAYKPTWTTKPTRDSDWAEVAKAVEDLLDYKVQTEMRLYQAMGRTLFDVTRLGIGALLTPWVTRTERVASRSFLFGRTTYREVPTFDGIRCQHLPIRDLIYPGGYDNLDDLPWWSRKMRWTDMDLDIQKLRKYYEGTDVVKKFKEAADEETRKAAERSSEETGEDLRALGHEFWFKYRFSKTGDYQRYVATVHLPSRTLMRLEEDTYPRWPLTLLRYGARNSGLSGLGIVEMVLPYDNALWALYNLLVDNYNIATMQCLKGAKGRGLTSKTQVYPGKLFLLDNPQTDLLSFPLGQPFALNPAFTRMVWELGERRAGISDYALGRESSVAGGRATATGTLALIQEGQRRIDLVIRDIRESMDDLGMFVLQMMHDRLPRRVPYMVLGERGAWVQQFLDLPSSAPQLSLRLISNFSNIATNKETEKQDALATFQLLERYYTSMIQLTGLIQQTQDPLRSVLIKIAQAAAEKVRKVLTTYGEMSPETYADVMTPITGPTRTPPPVEE